MKSEDLVKDGRYRMTGNTGSRRYMAPEGKIEEKKNLHILFGLCFLCSEN